MVFPTKKRRITGDGVGGGSDQVSTNANTSLHAGMQSKPIVGKLLNLSAEQTKDLNFPVGCPVWYNFSQVPGRRGSSFCEGVVSSVNLDILTKTLVFKVERNHEEKISPIDTVFEDDIAYAANCPIVLHSSGTKDKKVDGQILFANPTKGENGNSEMSYIVKTNMEGSQSLFSIEKGVLAERLRYRKTEEQPRQTKDHRVALSQCPIIPLLSPDTSVQENPEEQAHPSDIVSDEGENDSQKNLKPHKILCKREQPDSHRLPQVKLDADLCDGPHQTRKRKAEIEMNKNVSEKSVCWDPPHSWYENDGAI